MKTKKPKTIINVKLDGLVTKLNIRLQHLSDIMKFANISVEKITKSDFNSYKVFANLGVANNKSLSYEEAKEFFHDWCLRNNFRDSVESLSGFLEECYLVCSLVSARKSELIDAEKYNEIVSKKSGRFHKLNFPDKIDLLRNDFSVTSSLEQHVLSLNKVRNCLVHRSGIVGKKDLTSKDRLVAKFREFQIVSISPDKKTQQVINEPTTIATGHSVGIRVKDIEKTFKLRYKIDFESQEHARTIFTFFAFGIEIYKSIVKLAGLDVKGGDSVNFEFQAVEVNKKPEKQK